jgi:uncharacterized membrane protein YphA (DoxX/SURF4 family)
VSVAPGLIGRLDGTGAPLLAARLVLGGVMLYYAFLKIASPTAFLKELHNYGVLPEQPPIFINLSALLLPYVEPTVGTALVLGVLVRGAGLIVTVMMVVFMFALTERALGIQQASHLAFCAVKFDCGCGAGNEVYICNKLVENTLFTVLGLIAMLSRSRRFCVANWFHSHRAAAAGAS